MNKEEKIDKVDDEKNIDMETYQSSDEETPVPRSTQVTVDVQFHAEFNSEPVIRSPQAAHSEPKPKMMLPQIENLDEIFAIRDNLSWRIIARDLDFYRIKERKTEEQEEALLYVSLAGWGRPFRKISPPTYEILPPNGPNFIERPELRASPPSYTAVMLTPSPSPPDLMDCVSPKENRSKKRPFSDDKENEKGSKYPITPPHGQKKFKPYSPDIIEEPNDSRQLPEIFWDLEHKPLKHANPLDEFDCIKSTDRYDHGQPSQSNRDGFRQLGRDSSPGPFTPFDSDSD